MAGALTGRESEGGDTPPRGAAPGGRFGLRGWISSRDATADLPMLDALPLEVRLGGEKRLRERYMATAR